MLEKSTYPFVLPPLQFEYNALEPYIDKATVKIHYEKHFKSYIDKLNMTLSKFPEYQKISLEDMLFNINRFPEAIANSIKNYAGGVYNHDLYFELLTPNHSQKIPLRITKAFGGEIEFKRKMKNYALATFGSGYTWLVQSTGLKKELKIISLPNQNTPIPLKLRPILPIDVWEHSYYLRYRDARGDYIDNWFYLVDWKKVEERIK